MTEIKNDEGEGGELHGFAARAMREAEAEIATMRRENRCSALMKWQQHVIDNPYTGRQRRISEMIRERLSEALAGTPEVPTSAGGAIAGSCPAEI